MTPPSTHVGDLSQQERQQTSDRAAMWCDLLLGHRVAETAHVGVTRRAELYLRVAGLPLATVLDALETDEAGWQTRLAQLRARERENRAAHAGSTEREEAP